MHDIDFSVLFAGVDFGQAHPGNFGIGVHNRGNECVKCHGFTGENFGGDFAFVRGFVGKAGAWDSVADCKEAGIVCTHLGINFDESAIIGFNIRVFKADIVCIWASANAEEDAVEYFGYFRSSAFAVYFNTGIDFFNMRDARAGVYGAECLTQSGFEGFDQIGIGAGQEGVGHFDDCDGASQCRINTAEFETDDASANNEKAFGYFVEIERCCRVQNARGVERENWEGNWA